MEILSRKDSVVEVGAHLDGSALNKLENSVWGKERRAPGGQAVCGAGAGGGQAAVGQVSRSRHPWSGHLAVAQLLSDSEDKEQIPQEGRTDAEAPSSRRGLSEQSPAARSACQREKRALSRRVHSTHLQSPESQV